MAAAGGMRFGSERGLQRRDGPLTLALCVWEHWDRCWPSSIRSHVCSYRVVVWVHICVKETGLACPSVCIDTERNPSCRELGKRRFETAAYQTRGMFRVLKHERVETFYHLVRASCDIQTQDEETVGAAWYPCGGMFWRSADTSTSHHSKLYCYRKAGTKRAHSSNTGDRPVSPVVSGRALISIFNSTHQNKIKNTLRIKSDEFWCNGLTIILLDNIVNHFCMYSW